MRIGARYELANEMATLYCTVGRAEKGLLLDHFCGVTGYNRKYALSLLGGRQRRRRSARRRLLYGAKVQTALATLWEAAGYICAERLRPFLPELLDSLERHRALVVDAETRAKLSRISVATLKRRLKKLAVLVRGRRMSTTRPGSLLRRQIPVELSGFDRDVAGYLEIDLVAHCGDSGAGQFIYTLCATDLATGWTERVAVLGKGQALIVAAIEQIQAQLPFALRGLHSDNGSEFLNAMLLNWCKERAVAFTRGRPYRKNDNAHVEQKNWTLVRKLIGYSRLETPEQLAWLNALYAELLRPYNNCFQPVMKLVEKARRNGVLTKHYDIPKTPLRRVLAVGESCPMLGELEQLAQTTNPLALKRRIDRSLAAMPHALEVHRSA